MRIIRGLCCPAPPTRPAASRARASTPTWCPSRSWARKFAPARSSNQPRPWLATQPIEYLVDRFLLALANHGLCPARMVARCSSNPGHQRRSTETALSASVRNRTGWLGKADFFLGHHRDQSNLLVAHLDKSDVPFCRHLTETSRPVLSRQSSPFANEIERIGPTRRQDEEMMPPRLQQASPLSSRVSPRMAWGLAATMFLVGGSVVASSILADDGRMEAPRWVVSAAGAAFLLAGLALIKSYVLDRARERPGDVWGPFLGALVCSCFALVAGWI